MEAPSWDLPALRKYAETIAVRLERPGKEPPGDSRGTRAALWLLGRFDRTESPRAPIERRFVPAVGDCPPRLKSAMMECQKPFHLWNVRRDEYGDSLAFEAGPRYSVGRASQEGGPDREGRPGTVVPASKHVSRVAEENALVRAEAFGASRRLRRALEQDPGDEGLGVPD
jgi:hypothetical protein